MLLGLVLLGQTRAVVPAVLASVLVLLVFVPGRTRRAWVLAAVACGVAVALGPVLEVYDSGRRRRPAAWREVFARPRSQCLLGCRDRGRALGGADPTVAPHCLRRSAGQERRVRSPGHRSPPERRQWLLGWSR